MGYRLELPRPDLGQATARGKDRIFIEKGVHLLVHTLRLDRRLVVIGLARHRRPVLGDRRHEPLRGARSGARPGFRQQSVDG